MTQKKGTLLHSKLSRRGRLRAVALGASTALLVLAGSGIATAATPTGVTQKIDMELTKGKLKFVGPETVTVGDQLEIFNDTNPKQVGPHTFSLVTKGSLPKTRKAQNSCFTPKKICFAIAKWHGFNPKTEKISINLVKAGPAGWSTMGDASGKKGDSWFTGEKKKGTHVTQQVTAAAGTTLYFMCAVHPEMQGEVKVEAPVVPLPTPTS
jgi:plastocyanin